MDLDDYRYEIKSVTSQLHLPIVLSWVRAHAAGFRGAFPPRHVNSIYFDTPLWDGLADNLAGVAERAKLRLRWYGSEPIVTGGVLERKIKRNNLGRKIARPIGPPLDLRDANWTAIMRQLRSRDLGPPADSIATHTCPTLIMRYLRRYYVSADRCVRLTIDTDLCCFEQSHSATPNLRRPTPGESVMVVELKCLAEHGDRLSQIAGQWPLRRIAFSKYCNGVLDSVVASSPLAAVSRLRRDFTTPAAETRRESAARWIMRPAPVESEVQTNRVA